MSRKLTRRDLAAAALAAPAALAQAPPAPAKDSPAQLLAEAREQRRRTQETLAKYKLPMSTEPAFVFKA
jgi:hypothetical protein